MGDYESGPRALLFADGAAASERAAGAANLAGCRIMASVGVEDALELLRDPPPFDLVIADFEQDRGDLLDTLLHQLGDRAASGKGIVISAPFELTDIIAAHAWGPGVKHLSMPSDEQLVEAVSEAAQSTEPGLLEKDRLRQLSEEAARLASALAEYSARADQPPAPDAARNGPGEIGAHRVRAIIRARRLRGQFLPPDLFADPAWDMLLDLTAARLEGQHVAVSSLCIAAAVPPTTALRWIKALTEQGLFVRVADPSDGRRVHIELSDAAADAVLAYLQAAQRLGAQIL